MGGGDYLFRNELGLMLLHYSKNSEIRAPLKKKKKKLCGSFSNESLTFILQCRREIIPLL